MKVIVSCFGLVWKTYEQPPAWITGNELLRHILGTVSLLHLHLVGACDAHMTTGINCISHVGNERVV
jgi:hypothetical protein